MKNNDEENIKEYERLNGIVTEIEIRMNNLKKTEGEISKERYSSQEKEYIDLLDKLNPKLSDIGDYIKDRLIEYEKELNHIQEEINPINESIDQEKKLYKIGAISKRNYKITVQPLENKLKELKSRYDMKKNQVVGLRKTLEKKTQNWKPNLSGPGGKPDIFGKGDFKKDVWTGTKTIVTIAIVAIVGLPLLGLALGTGQILAGPFVIITVIVILIAVFGKVINFVKEHW